MNSEYLPEPGYKRIAVLCLYAAIAAAALYVIVKYLIWMLLPFIIAWVAALFLRPLISYLSRRFRLPDKAVSIIIVFAVFAAAGVLLFLLSDRLIWESGRLMQWLAENADTIVGDISALLEDLASRIPLIGKTIDEEYIISAVSELINGALSTVTSSLPGLIGAVIRILPGSVFFAVILVIACFYMCIGYGEIGGYILRRLPKPAAALAGRVKSQFSAAGKRYLRAYAAMFAITFAELLTGFLLLKIDYAFMLALIVAAVDILPILGTGTVLIPWGALLLFSGNYYTGFGLLIIYAAVTVLRQIIEPRIVGESLGLHPLATLMAIYAGFKICGFIGIIIFPIALIMAINLFRGEKVKSKKEENTTNQL